MESTRYFGVYNSEGLYTSFYTTDIWDVNDIPVENIIEITFEQWQQALETQCGVINNTHSVIERSAEELNENKMVQVRNYRNLLLSNSDWTQMSDSPLSDDKKAEWAIYRQILRNLPNTVDLNNVVYPTQPA
jgi:hypothetical protein